MNVTTHERPGVYSVYGASSLVRGSGGRKTVGLAAVNTKAEAGVIQTITSYEEAVSTFGSQADSQDMAELIRVILLNGAAAVAVVPVANAEGYEAAFAAMSGMEDLSVVVCDSTDQEVQQKLRDSVTAASAARRERIAVVAGGAEESVTALTDRAKALNSERVVLAAPGGVSEKGTALSGLTAAAAVAGAIAGQGDPAVPLGGAELLGLNGLWFCLLLLGEKFLWGHFLEQLPSPIRWACTMLAVILSWVLFRAADLGQAWAYLGAMFGQTTGLAQDGQAVYYLLQFWPEWILALIAFLPVKQWLQSWLEARGAAGQTLALWAPRVLALGLLVLSYGLLVTGSFNPFIYFQF